MKITQQNYSYVMKILQICAFIAFALIFIFATRKASAHVDLTDPVMGLERFADELKRECDSDYERDFWSEPSPDRERVSAGDV